MNPGIFKTTWSFKFLLSFCLLLQLPLFLHSVQTPFALIDEYADWTRMEFFSSQAGFWYWFEDAININKLKYGRFRPFMEIYSAVVWTLFGDNSTLHHLARWIIKGLSAWLITLIILDISKSYSALENFKWPAFVGCVFFLFFPNAPDARLGPQEPLTAFFILGLILSTIKLLREIHTNDRCNSKTIFFIYIWTLGALMFKEIGFFFVAPWIGLLNIWLIMNKKIGTIAKLSGLWIFIIFTFFKLLNMSGSASLPLRILSNFRWVIGSISLSGVSILIPILFFLPLLGLILHFVKKFNHNYKLTHIDYIVIATAVSSASILIGILLSPHGCYRYVYPLLPSIAILLGVGVTIVNLSKKSKGSCGILIGLSCIFFIGINYFNLYTQYSYNRASRTSEAKLLSEIKALIDQGDTVVTLENEEFQILMHIYFKRFLPYFHKIHIDQSKFIGADERHKPIPAEYFAVARLYDHQYESLENGVIYQDILFEPDPLSPYIETVSKWFGFGKKPRFTPDCGSDSFLSKGWRIFKVTKPDVQ